MINVMDGRALANEIKNKLKDEILNLGLYPTLAVIQIGNDKSSSLYVQKKSQACNDIGINCLDFQFDADADIDGIIELIDSLNESKNVNGILIQQPLPSKLKGIEQLVFENKDVDGFTFLNQGKRIQNNNSFIPCTTLGILDLIDKYKIDLNGKHVVIVGRSNIVGKPTAVELINRNATVTLCHSHTKNLDSICKTSDILIVAIGKANFINSNYIGENTNVVIDVGINRTDDNKVIGDCDFDDIINFWSNCELDTPTDKYITPVPGGIGPLTIAELMKNVVISSKSMIKC